MDYGSWYTDETERRVRDRIKSVYREASKDIDDKMKDFYGRYRKKEAIYAKQVKDGKISKEDFDDWKKGQVFQGKQWKNKKDQILDTIYHANTAAAGIINDNVKGVFAANGNYMAYSIEKGVNANFGFGLYDERTVARLLEEDRKLLPEWKIDEPKDYVWNNRKVGRQITQGIIQGESLDAISKRLSSSLVAQNENSMKTFARTAMTGAQNAGRMTRLKDAQSLGIRVNKEWMCTLDGRTRDAHRHFDGMSVPINKPFKYDGMSIMYPGDPEADASLVYNCRCTLVADVLDYPSEYERGDNIDGNRISNMTYEDWYEAKGKTNIVASKVLQAARNAEKAITRDLSHAVGLGSGHLEGLDFRFKGRNSLERKIDDKSAKKNVSRDQYARQITDALRYTNVSSPKNLTDDYLKIVSGLESKGYSMVEVVNTLWDKTAEYRGINTLVSTPKGYIFELQFHTPQSIKIKEINHKLYEEQRLATTSEDRKIQLGIEMINNAKSIITPANIDTIVNKLLDKPIRQW